MNEDLAHCLVEVYLNSMELLGTGLRVVEGLPEDGPIGNELLSACREAVFVARSFRRGDVRRIPGAVEQVRERFHTAETLLRRLHRRKLSSRPHVTAAIEIAERGGEAAVIAARLFAAGRYR